MKRTFVILSCIVFVCSMHARDWTAYMSYHNNTYNHAVEGKVYSLASGSVFTYRSGETMVKTFSKPSGLSGTDISQMIYNEEEEAFLLVYSDNNIDVLGVNDSITNMAEFKSSTLTDKTINSITVSGRNAYLAVGNHVMVVNMEHREFSNTYNLGRKVNSCTEVGKNIYASTSDGLFVGDTKKNLLDVSNWKCLSTGIFGYIFAFNKQLYIRAGSGIFRIDLNTAKLTSIVSGNYPSYQICGENIVTFNDSQICVIDKDEKVSTYKQPNAFKSVSYDGEYFWASCGMKGLLCYEVKNDSLSSVGTPVVPNSPIRNLPYHLSYTSTGRLLIAGGDLNYTGIVNDATIMLFENGSWLSFKEDSVSQKTGIRYIDITSLVQDPNDPSHHFASSANGGLYEYRNFQYYKHYDSGNSPLSTILPQDKNPRLFTRVTGLSYDTQGNLWMMNNQVDTILRIKTAKGGWKSYYFASLKGYPTFDKILFDSHGYVWINHRRTTAQHHAGILGLNYDNTSGLPKSFNWKFKYQFTNQDNTSYTFNEVYDVVEDRLGRIWIGTDKGPFVLTSPADFFKGTPTFTQIKVPRNDGTKYADYLLSGVPITCMAVDGGGRLWFGTNGSGVYLVSEDGLTTVQHYTSLNSPLLSDVIRSIAVNPTSNVVMIGTEAGLIAYRSDATSPEKSFSEAKLKIYPNPARPEYSGNVRIEGLTFESDVKITTVNGAVVAQGKSVGGTFTWNLCDVRGQRVNTGVYYVVVSNQNGSDGIVGKITVIGQ